MRPLRSLIPLFASLALCALAPAVAQAGSYDPNGFRFSSPTYTVHENAGQAVITITRTDASRPATAYYVAVGLFHQCGSTQCTATPPGNGDAVPDFGGTNGSLAFAAGETSKTFTVAIVDHHQDTLSKTLELSIFNSWNEGTADQSKAVLTIVNDDPTPARDPNNPLELPVAPGASNPLAGASFFVDPDSEAAKAARKYPAIGVIAGQPVPARWGSFSGPDVALWVSRYLERAAVQQPGTVPMFATYKLVDHNCGNYTPTAADVAGYHDFVDKVASGIGSYPVVMFLEMDSLITSPCLSSQGLAVRMAELRYAIATLNADCPHVVIYMDAGAGDAIPADQTARLLLRAGVGQAQGFFLNSTHYDWTSSELAFGEQVSRLTGGKHFVVNTAVNGRGPLVPADRVHHGNEVLCNPAGRGLGPKPTSATGFPNADAFAWIGNPGESGGACVPGAPPTGVYWPAYALMLVHNAVFSVDDHTAVSARASRASSHHKKPARKHHKRQRKHKKHKKHSRRASSLRRQSRIYAHMDA